MKWVKIDFSLSSNMSDLKIIFCKIISYFLVAMAIKIMFLTTHYCSSFGYFRKPFNCFKIVLITFFRPAEFGLMNIINMIFKAKLSKSWPTIYRVPGTFGLSANVNKELDIVFL